MPNTWTNFYPTLWSDQAFVEFSDSAIAPRIVNMTWVSPDGAAEAIRIPKFAYSESDVDDLSNLYDSPDDVSEATLLLNIDREKGFHFQVRYVEQDKANVRLGQTMVLQRTAALANVVDKDVFSTVTGATTTLSGSVNKATLVSAIELLNENSAPQSNRVLVTNPDGYSDLLNTNDFVKADSIAGAVANRTGAVGQVLGLEVYLSNNLPTAANVDAFVAHRSAVAMAMLQTIDVRVFDQPRHFAVGYTGRATWGRTLIDANLVVPIDRT